MRRVIIESPYAANSSRNLTVEGNLEYARTCMAHSISQGEAPLASHLLYTQPGILNDEIASERELGINCGFSWLELADAVVLYTDLGISKGMQEAENYARSLSIPVSYRRLGLHAIEVAYPEGDVFHTVYLTKQQIQQTLRTGELQGRKIRVALNDYLTYHTETGTFTLSYNSQEN